MSEEAPNHADINDLKPKEGQLVRAAEAQTESAVGLVAGGEMLTQIEVAHRWPRSLTHFRKQAIDMACLNEAVAAECLFAVSRDGKVIEGPSIRLAEIIASCWRNCQVGSTILHEGKETVIARGFFRDLENNYTSQSDIARRIINKQGRRYSLDMIVTTTNAAQAIAKRNAITAGVPRALWWDIYKATRAVAAGDVKSLATKRSDAIKAFQVYGVDLPKILAKLGRPGEEEVTRDDLVLLYGIFTSIKDEEMTPEEAFPEAAPIIVGGGKAPEAPTVTDEGEAAARAKMQSAGIAPELLHNAKPPTQGVAPQGIPPPDVGVPGVVKGMAPPGVFDPPGTEPPRPRANRRKPQAME